MSIEVSFEDALRGGRAQGELPRALDGGRPRACRSRSRRGAVDGGRLRYKERGEYGTNGGARGDLVVTTRVGSHPFYTRDGADVRMTLPVSMYEAALGTEVQVPAPNGETLRVKIPAGTQSGKIFRFKGLGAPDVKHKGSTGAFYVTVDVQIPTDLTSEERDALTRLRDHDARDPRSHIGKGR